MEDLNRQVVEGLEAAILLVDGEGKVIFANERAMSVLGRDLKDSNLCEGEFENDTPLVIDVVEGYRRERARHEACGQLLISTEEEAVRYYWMALSGGSGEGDARVVMLQDISAPLIEAPAIRRIFSQVSHDLKSPLTSIAGAAELLLSGRVGTMDGVQRRLLRIVEEGTRRMSAILTRTKGDLAQEKQAAGGEGGE